ncbi:MAG: MFS transporter [bacterium]|nr:MFS transporter [bacterium]
MTDAGGNNVAPGRHALLAATMFLLMMPETLPVPVLRGLVIERFGVDDSLATLFMVANMLGALLAAPIAGLWVDRSGRRRRLCILALLCDAVAMQALAHPLDYGVVLALRVVEGSCHIIALTMLMSLVADSAGERRGRALGSLGVGLTLGVATGAAIGGIIGKNEPLVTIHAASGLLLLATLAAAWLLPPDITPEKRPGWREVLVAFRDSPTVRTPLLLAFIDRFTVGFFTTGFPLLLAGVHGVDRPTIGMLLAAFLYPFGLLSYPFGRLAERWSRRRLVGFGSLIYGLGVISIGTLSPATMWFVMPLLGIGSAVMFVPTLLWLLERSPGIGRSTAMASFHAAGSLGFLLGPLACGFLVQLGDEPSTGYVIAFAVAGLTEIVGAALVVRAVRRTDVTPH